MWFNSVLSRNSTDCRRGVSRSKPRPRRQRDHSCRMGALEALEDRCLLSFNPAVNYPVGSNPLNLVVADFSRDTRLDIAVVNTASSTVSVLLGNADGTFQPAQNSATGATPLSLAVGDLDGDGKMDITTANDGNISVLRGNGDGTFQPPNDIDIGTSPTSVAVGDFNADGKLDLAVTSRDSYYVPPWGGCGYYGCYGGGGYWINYGVANVLLGNGAGSFAAPSTTSLGQGNFFSTVAADLNGDGRRDFASVNGDYSSIAVAPGNGAGGLGSPTYWGTGYYAISLTAGDVNGDNKIDLVTANTSSTVSVLLGDGLGSFGSAQNFNAGLSPRTVAVADFNGDTKADLVTANWDTGTVSVLLGTGTGSFQPPVDVAAGTAPTSVAVGDFDGNGRPDVASSNSGSANVSVLLNDGLWPALDAPSITIASPPGVTEGNVGTTNASFAVTLSAPSSQTITVAYSTLDDHYSTTATAGVDYQSTVGTLTFAPGVTTQTFIVPVIGDRVGEPNESFSVRLSNPANAFVASSFASATIVDDEPYVSITAADSVVEGNTGTTVLNFTVTLSAQYQGSVTVDYATADFTVDEEYWYGPGAKAGTDYVAKSGTLTFPEGQTSLTVPVQVMGDRVAESTEYFWLKLSNPTSAQLGTSYGTGSITDDEPYVSITGGSVTEGHSGTKNTTFTVTLSNTYDLPVVVSYATADGSATVAGGDYQAKTSTVTIPAGQPSNTFTVVVKGDRLGEGDEYFAVNMTAATNAGLGYPTASATIVDDEPRISILNAVSVKEGANGTKVMTFTVVLSAAYDQTVTVKYGTSDGSATVADNDYLAKTGTLTFLAGQTTQKITVTIKGDKKREQNEWFAVILSDSSSNAYIGTAVAYATILNDDTKGRR
jgi:hypothetical protein